jgi:hypothetical protein
VYTESLFLLLLLLAFWAIRREAWVWCALAAAGAALTRNAGPVIFGALVLTALERRRDGKPFLPLLYASPFPLLAFALVQLFFVHKFGQITSVTSQSHYYRALCLPWTPIWRDLVGLVTGRALEMTTLLNLGATFLGLAFTVVLIRRGFWAYALLIGGILAMHLTLGHTIVPYTSPSLRYMMSTFPFAALLAHQLVPVVRKTRNRLPLILLALVMAGIYSYLIGIKSFEG